MPQNYCKQINVTQKIPTHANAALYPIIAKPSLQAKAFIYRPNTFKGVE